MRTTTLLLLALGCKAGPSATTGTPPTTSPSTVVGDTATTVDTAATGCAPTPTVLGPAAAIDASTVPVDVVDGDPIFVQMGPTGEVLLHLGARLLGGSEVHVVSEVLRDGASITQPNAIAPQQGWFELAPDASCESVVAVPTFLGSDAEPVKDFACGLEGDLLDVAITVGDLAGNPFGSVSYGLVATVDPELDCP